MFVRVWQKLGSFRGDSAFSTWLHRLAVNVVIERFRQDTARRQRLHDGEHIFDTLAAPPRSRDVVMDFEAALETLPDGARQIFVLHDVEGYKHREIGTLLDISSGTSKAQLHRARMMLRRYLGRRSKMTTEDAFTDRLSDYLDDEDLSPAERGSIAAHIMGCAACRETLEDLRAVRAHAASLVDSGSGRRSLAGARGSAERGPTGAPVRSRGAAPLLLHAAAARRRRPRPDGALGRHRLVVPHRRRADESSSGRGAVAPGAVQPEPAASAE